MDNRRNESLAFALIGFVFLALGVNPSSASVVWVLAGAVLLMIGRGNLGDALS
ncbi:hypothetical protein K0651_02150 [Ornithinimicrobium sp. Arc0846-15]|nr:hypothetical protein [Ornithinimicrobium laminariae]